MKAILFLFTALMFCISASAMNQNALIAKTVTSSVEINEENGIEDLNQLVKGDVVYVDVEGDVNVHVVEDGENFWNISKKYVHAAKVKTPAATVPTMLASTRVGNTVQQVEKKSTEVQHTSALFSSTDESTENPRKTSILSISIIAMYCIIIGLVLIVKKQYSITTQSGTLTSALSTPSSVPGGMPLLVDYDENNGHQDMMSGFALAIFSTLYSCQEKWNSIRKKVFAFTETKTPIVEYTKTSPLPDIIDNDVVTSLDIIFTALYTIKEKYTLNSYQKLEIKTRTKVDGASAVKRETAYRVKFWEENSKGQSLQTLFFYKNKSQRIDWNITPKDYVCVGNEVLIPIHCTITYPTVSTT